MKTCINTIAAISCLLPLAILAAPSESYQKRASDTAAVWEDMPIVVTPKYGCNTQGASFDSLGSADAIAKTVALGCGDYADDPNRVATFEVGQSIQWCTNTVDGTGSVNLGMTYRGDEAGTQLRFTPDPAGEQGGIAQYCWVGMTWARTTCKQGGSFFGHRLDNAQGPHYWDFKVDPNSKPCGQ